MYNTYDKQLMNNTIDNNINDIIINDEYICLYNLCITLLINIL